MLSETLMLSLCKESGLLQISEFNSRAIEGFFPSLPGSGIQDTQEVHLQQQRGSWEVKLTVELRWFAS